MHRAERMRPSERLDTQAMAETLSAAGVRALAFDDNSELKAHLIRALAKPRCELIVFLTNGSFDGLPRALAHKLKILR